MRFTPVGIPHDACEKITPAFEKFGVHDAADWIDRCRNDQAGLWVVENCWAITEVFSCKSGLICHVVALAGDYEQSLLREIETWANSMGCNKMLFTGRKGWQRRLKDYSAIAVVMTKDIK